MARNDDGTLPMIWIGCPSTAAAPGFALPNKTGGLFPNPYNKYLCTPVDYMPGRIVVIRGLAPTFPNTSAGQSVLTNTQLRYWSLCQNQWRLPYPVSACAADYQTTLDTNRRYTYVVSAPQDRPVNATPAQNVTWISWGPTDVTGLLLFRNMLPAADFPNAIQSAARPEPGRGHGSLRPNHRLLHQGRVHCGRTRRVPRPVGRVTAAHFCSCAPSPAGSWLGGRASALPHRGVAHVVSDSA